MQNYTSFRNCLESIFCGYARKRITENENFYTGALTMRYSDTNFENN